ncbi:hypothetical protein [Mesorhizobium sp. WSM4904]|uniref:hypothetical protein n=1 Tax=Mesorhizobium sp. WSM4904 TaxID=3038545 RepID=UPI002418A8BA|nr:hypothetical protein [Mesorhizobium sp. WSM4904]WFP63746.1 hypothetical protein QAZ47_03960 [Mesorhizobium sp. WSM4904]
MLQRTMWFVAAAFSTMLAEFRAGPTQGAADEDSCYDNFKPGVTLDDLRPYLRDEVSNVWRLWKAGIVRENYARADVGGVIIVFELDSIEEARRYTDDFPLSKAGLLEWHFIAFDAPLPLEFLFDPTVDIAKPWDRTAA